MKPRRRYAVRTPLRPPGTEVPGQREMLAVREVVHAFLNADQPHEAFQFALDRVAPAVGASLASVYLIDGASELMRLAAAYNWPDRLRPWLSDVRVRVGFGPSGEAASERRVIEVPDVLADPDLEDWQEVARELGFRALVALPLQVGPTVLGAVAFYFADWGDFTAERRGLLRLVADLMAAAAEKARLMDRARRAEAAAVEALTELDRQYVAVARAKRAGREFIDRVAATLGPMVEGLSPTDAAQSAGAVLDDLVFVADIHDGLVDLVIEPFDPHLPLREAVRTLAMDDPQTPVVVEDPPAGLPPLWSDRQKVVLLLARLLSRAVRTHDRAELRVSTEVVGGRAEYRIPGRADDDPGWYVAEALATLLGGTIDGDGTDRVVVALPLEGRPAAGTNQRRT